VQGGNRSPSLGTAGRWPHLHDSPDQFVAGTHRIRLPLGPFLEPEVRISAPVEEHLGAAADARQFGLDYDLPRPSHRDILVDDFDLKGTVDDDGFDDEPPRHIVNKSPIYPENWLASGVASLCHMMVY